MLPAFCVVISAIEFGELGILDCWEQLNCVHERTHMGNNIPGFCEAKRKCNLKMVEIPITVRYDIGAVAHWQKSVGAWI